MSTGVPTLGIVVLGYNNFARYTRPCLESLLPQLTDQCDTILFDNASPDGAGDEAEAWLAAQAPKRLPANIKICRSQNNLGFAGGMNAAAEKVSGTWLLLVNNDTLFPEGAIRRLLEVLNATDERTGAVGMLSNAAGNAQQLRFEATADAAHRPLLDYGRKLHDLPTGLNFEAYRLDFFCVAIRRTAWVALEGLDTDFGRGYYEDFDFSLRLRKAGWSQLISEDVFVLHIGSGAFSAISAEQKQLLKANRKRLLARHPDARLENQRMDNLAILIAYQSLPVQPELPAPRWRLEKRLADLRDNPPKSLLKRWRWQRRTRPVLAWFAERGVVANPLIELDQTTPIRPAAGKEIDPTCAS